MNGRSFSVWIKKNKHWEQACFFKYLLTGLTGPYGLLPKILGHLVWIYFFTLPKASK